MADTIVRVYENETRVIIEGAGLISPLVAEAQAAVDDAEAQAALAAASAAEAEASAIATAREYGILATNAEGVAEGFYPAAFDVPELTIKRVYGQVVSGTGECSATIFADSEPIHGPFTVTPTGVLTTGLTIGVALGATIDVLLEDTNGTQTSIVVKVTGNPA